MFFLFVICILIAMKIDFPLFSSQRHLPPRWKYPAVDNGKISYSNLDLRFPIDGSDGIRSAGERMHAILKETFFPEIDKYDLIMANELSAPLSVESFENDDRCDAGEVWRQKKYYRTPNYLVSIEDRLDYRMLATNLLNCACIRFYSEAEGFRYLSPDKGLKYPFTELKMAIEGNNTDIVIASHKSSFRKISSFLKDGFPHIPLLIYCEEKGRWQDPEKYEQLAMDLRGEGYFACTTYEILDKQEYVSRLIAHALGPEGIKRLRICTLPMLE